MKDQLQNMLSEQLGSQRGIQLVGELSSSLGRRDGLDAVLVLLGELRDLSDKVADAAVETLPELQRRGILAETVQWLDLALALTHVSGAATLRYLRESPLLISLVDPPLRRPVLTVMLELVEDDHTVALEFLRTAPELAPHLQPDDLERWAMRGAELARTDQVAGVEFIRRLPEIVRTLPWDDVPSWIEFGLKLVTTNSLGKTDYFGTVEFFRTSPAVLAEIHPREARALTIRLSSRLADSALDIGATSLAEAPVLLKRLPSDEWRVVFLQFGLLVAERDAAATLSYLRRASELLALLGPQPDARHRFDEWFRTGMEILEYSVEGGRAYFAAETNQALTAIEQALSGVPLRRIARSLTLFAQALSGAPVSIQGLAEGEGERPRAMATADGLVIRLPALLRRKATAAENERLYMVMTAHEAGHQEFGTYDIPLSRLRDLMASMRPGPLETTEEDPRTLADVFACYPQPGLIRDLWTLIEDARVEYLLQREYPGLQRDLAALAAESVRTRTLSHGLTAREMIVDHLLLLSTTPPETFAIPEAIADIVGELWSLVQTIFTPGATSEEAVRLAHRVYHRLEDLVGQRAQSVAGDVPPAAETMAGVGPRASEEMSADYRPVDNLDYRGAMDPESIQGRSEESSQAAGAEEAGPSVEQFAGPAGSGPRQAGPVSAVMTREDGLAAGREAPSLTHEVLALEDSGGFEPTAVTGSERSIRYPEWDATVNDYRPHWCSVMERQAEEGGSDFVEQTLAGQRGPIRLLRRYFESLRPVAIRRLAGQIDGEDVDLDALVRRYADVRAGGEPSDHIYIRGDRRARDVAAAILIDVSGSTSRQVSPGRRVIDIEKEGLVLFCEALEAIGDQFAVYGYSGRGRKQVDFIVVKDFDDPISGQAARKLGGVTPLHQNRDGAAIRHATRKLSARPAKTRLLILISDGRPLDDGYKDDYALEDTKMALREARMQGIDPFCITIDRDADAYLRRMYGDVRYIVIDHVEQLPGKLPKIYHRLTA